MSAESINNESPVITALHLALKNDLRDIVKQTLLTESIDGVNTLTKNVKQSAQGAARFAIRSAKIRELPKWEKIQKQTQTTFKSLKAVPARITKGGKTKFAQVIATYDALQSNEDKILAVMEYTAYALSTTAGICLGGASPDMDIKLLGIGKHRHYAFHSALSTIAVSKLTKILCRLFQAAENYLPPEATESDIKFFQFTKTNLELIAFGYSVGVAQHLFVDGAIENTKSVVSPWGNTFVKHTLLDDNIYLMTNAAGACREGINILQSDVAHS